MRCRSGGPLLDSFGRLVGLCTASFTRSGSVSGRAPSRACWRCCEQASSQQPRNHATPACLPLCLLQGRGSGVNFALPADLLRTTVPNLIVTGNAAGRGVRSGGVA